RPLKARPRQTNHAANLAAEMPSRTRRDFFQRQTNRQTPFRESSRARDCTEPPCRRFRSPVCSLAGPSLQSSANKEQRLRLSESEKLFQLGKALVDLSLGIAAEDQSCSILQPRARSNDRRPLDPPMCPAPTTTKEVLPLRR